MAGDLLWHQYRLLDAGQSADLSELGELHVLQALGILGQAHVTHAALNVVNEPALAEDRNNRDALAGNVASVLEHLAAGHDVLADLLALDSLLPNLHASDCKQGFLKRFIVCKVGLAIALFFAGNVLENADGL